MRKKLTAESGFSLIELLAATAIMLILLSITSTLLYRAFGIRSRESRRTDALTSAEAALNVMSREISNAGFGLYNDQTKDHYNGIVEGDSDKQRIHFRSNITNFGLRAQQCPPFCTSDPGEDVTFFFDEATNSIVRYDPNDEPKISVIVNRISNVKFKYFDYTVGLNGTVTVSENDVPSPATGRIEIAVDVALDPVHGQPSSSVRFKSEVNLRNSSYMLRQY